MQKDPHTGVMYRKEGALSVKAVLLLVHGLGAHSERWQFLSEYFVSKGISTYSIELRGFGETTTRKGHIDSFDSYFDDIHCLFMIIKNENPSKKIFIAGESMGGLLGFLMCGTEPDLFDGVICLAPAFASRLPVTLFMYADIVMARFMCPKKKFTVRITPAMCTRDPECQKMLEDDPREIRFATANLLCEIARAEVSAVVFKDKIKCPVLFSLAGQDKVVNVQASEKIFEFLD
ncbi:MAG: alpha/beta fold hydrolase, partial [Candidatus Heimdallarchaeota archaeon]|nr:alpha/beta fold hydrolase [Candidatus Heimdallarchaeota archaeon]